MDFLNHKESSGNYQGIDVEIEADQDMSDDFHSVSFYADRFNLNCFWTQDSKVNMEEINLMLNSIDDEIANDHYKNQTPSNFSGMISSSFPSETSAFSDSKLEDESELEEIPFIASTPCYHDYGISAKRRRQEAFKDFVDASPILSSPRAIGGANRNALTRRKLNMDFELSESDEIEKRVKVMKII